jgi:hypothetical protein
MLKYQTVTITRDQCALLAIGKWIQDNAKSSPIVSIEGDFWVAHSWHQGGIAWSAKTPIALARKLKLKF